MTDIKLICLDMDGTLLGADHATVPARNIRALRAASEGMRETGKAPQAKGKTMPKSR